MNILELLVVITISFFSGIVFCLLAKQMLRNIYRLFRQLAFKHELIKPYKGSKHDQ